MSCSKVFGKLVQFSGIFGLFALFVLLHPSPGRAAESAPVLAQRSKDLLALATRVGLNEPFLYSVPQFASEQEWTLTYQGFVRSELNAGEFKRLFVLPAKAVRVDQIAKAYVKYAKIASRLVTEVFDHVELHRRMYVDIGDDKLYVTKFNSALATMLPDSEGDIVEFKQLDCDYVSQPTDALWFSANAMIVIDDYGQALFGARWEALREEARRAGGLLSREEIRQAVEKGLPYSVPPHLRN